MDFNQAGLLLHIADKARQWPNLKKLEMAALAELEKIQAGGERTAAPTADAPRRMRSPSTGDSE